MTPLESERIQGFPDNWTLPLDSDDDPDNIDSQRYHAAGNAVTVNVAEWIGHRVRAAIEQRNAAQAAAKPAKKPARKRSEVDANVLV